MPVTESGPSAGDVPISADPIPAGRMRGYGQPASRVWCSRSAYTVVGNQSEVVGQIEGAVKAKSAFVFFDIAPRDGGSPQVALAIDKISAVEKA